MATVAASEQTALHCASFKVSRIDEERCWPAMVTASLCVNKAKAATPIHALEAVHEKKNNGNLEQDRTFRNMSKY